MWLAQCKNHPRPGTALQFLNSMELVQISMSGTGYDLNLCFSVWRNILCAKGGHRASAFRKPWQSATVADVVSTNLNFDDQLVVVMKYFFFYKIPLGEGTYLIIVCKSFMI